MNTLTLDNDLIILETAINDSLKNHLSDTFILNCYIQQENIKGIQYDVHHSSWDFDIEKEISPFIKDIKNELEFEMGLKFDIQLLDNKSINFYIQQ